MVEQIKELICTLNRDKKLLYNISNDDVRIIIEIATACLCTTDKDYEFKYQCFEFACNTIRFSNIPIEEKWSLYCSINSIGFTEPEYDIFTDELLLCYKEMFFEEKKHIDEELLQPLEENTDGPIVMTISQFLGIKHAPTRRILDYSYTIKKYYHKEIVIINDCNVNCNLYDFIKMRSIPNFQYEHCNANIIEYKGVKFHFYQGNKKMPDFDEINKILTFIRELRPSLVINIGADSITSDLCSYFVKTVTIPCSTRIPVSMAENLVVCREIRDEDSERISRLEPWQNLISSRFNYIMPPKDELPTYTREQFGISDSAFVITSAGNRMNDEITEEFIHAIDVMLDKIEDSVFLLIGRFHNNDILKNEMKNYNRVIIPGNVEYASELIKLTDVYIQPKRKGGGRAAFEALYYGVPVFLLPYGDAWDVCGRDFEVSDYTDMINHVCKLKTDSEYRKSMVQTSLNRGKILEDMPGMFRELFADLESCYKN